MAKAKTKRISCKQRHRNRWKRGRGTVTKVGLDPSSYLEAEQIMMVLNYCRNRAARGGVRAAVTLILVESYFYTGLRAIELLGLSLIDLPGFNGHSNIVRIPADFAKGQKQRIILISSILLSKWEAYIQRFHKRAIAGIRSGDRATKEKALRTPLFLNERFQPMEYHNVWHRLRIVRKNTGVELRPHICRHTYATQLLKKSGNLEELQDLLGHVSPATTRIYAKTLKASTIQNLERLNFG